jgi:hypothetical protein
MLDVFGIRYCNRPVLAAPVGVPADNNSQSTCDSLAHSFEKLVYRMSVSLIVYGSLDAIS